MMIEAKKLVKIYNGNIKAVDGIDLSIEKGEIYGFLGPNGAGKTTTVKMLTTLLKPTSGYASINGLDVVKEQEKVRKIIGLVPQDLSVDDDLKGIENLELQASFYGIGKEEARKKAKELLELVDLYHARDRYVSTYSGGMRKRLDLVSGLIHEPEVLFLDEPTLGLDVQTRTKMWEYIENLRKNLGITIFITTHYLEEADRLCDRIGIIDKGRIMVEGRPEELKNSVGFDLIYILSERPEEIKKYLDNAINIEILEDGTIRFSVHNSEEYIPLLLQKIYQAGIKIKRLSIQKPSLDTVFLKYTGREMREDESREDIIRTMRAIRRAR
ncbi:MAG: ATP-binding cassette domain-containing protein [Thermoplasmata archaeon]|jgi:ABC-2 type transport system ATP-binding protein|nr:ATP-binding cassette domain-containing protein [Thermoplasmata archaeon]MVT15243.1 ATP-binding cassette domain-containing protein [Euryarchaeota archaeon]MVT36268.1 ATP-binding cassette domain-containing protein [Euryarchaeota archaeon]